MFSRLILSTLLASGALTAFAAVPVENRTVGQAHVQSDKASVAERFRGSKSAAYRVTATAWDRSVVAASQKAATADEEKRKPLQIGYARGVEASLQAIPMASLAWETLGDGSKTARVEINAAEAAGLRAGYRVDGPVNGIEVRFAGNGRDEVYLSDAKAGEILWSPVLEGDTATLELSVLPGYSPSQFTVRVDQLSHLLAVGADLGRKDSRDIGDSGSCNIDVACVSNPSQALLDAAKATAKIIFTDAGSSYLCSGTLLNSSPSTGVPYFYTAAHCIDTQAAASTMNSYWFFDAVSCNSLAIPPYQLVTGGTTLLVTDPTMDVTLLQMRQSPPAGAVLAAWNATVIPTGTTIVGLHHPSGDLKKFSQGSMLGYTQGPAAYGNTPRPQAGRDSFITVRWVDGTTEGGSSGSGLFTYDATCGGGGAACYQLRGGLEGGAASCSNRSGPDRYSRMDLLYTKLSPWLQPSGAIPTSNAAVSSMVEYYMPQFDYYFMTTREGEKSTLDTLRDANTNPVFYRTGYWFKTNTTSTSGTSSLTRYFIPGVARAASRGTHFYTALNADKAAITATGKERFSSGCSGVPNTYFCNEGIDSYIATPIGTGPSSTCLSTERKIYRVFRGAPNFTDDGNHRYLTSEAMYNYMVGNQGWTGEYVNFCAQP